MKVVLPTLRGERTILPSAEELLTEAQHVEQLMDHCLYQNKITKSECNLNVSVFQQFTLLKHTHCHLHKMLMCVFFHTECLSTDDHSPSQRTPL